MNGAHLHLILTHLPVVGVFGAMGILAVGIWRRQEVLQRTGLVLMFITGLTAGTAYLTGEGAEELLEGQVGIAERMIEDHEDAAQIGLVVTGAVGLLSLGILVVSRGRAVRRGAAIAVLAGAVAASGALAWTANLGGQIRHPEINSALGTHEPTAPDARDDDD